MMQHLYSRNDVLFIVDKYACDLCRNNLMNVAFHYFNSRYLNKEELELVICGSCAKAMPREYSMFGHPEIRTAIVVDVVPLGAFPILSPTEFKHSMTIPEAMSTVARDVRTVDRTRFANRVVFDGTEQIGKSPDVVDDDTRKRLESVDAAPLDFLIEQRDAQPLLPGMDDEKKLLR